MTTWALAWTQQPYCAGGSGVAGDIYVGTSLESNITSFECNSLIENRLDADAAIVTLVASLVEGPNEGFSETSNTASKTCPL